ncbi:unnamed protein product [Allacma fusca]|uniref:Uncharacterized protein n=1 Tax=Allacma fusca TaxID=39272 RepID=A0A8J2KPV7_9HEXA|nr:unnamed protein product [Allacma fusca]
MKFFYVIFALVLLVCSAVVNANARKDLPMEATENKEPKEIREGRHYGGGGHHHHHHHHGYGYGYYGGIGGGYYRHHHGHHHHHHDHHYGK